MDLNEYQTAARSTAVYPRSKAVVYPALGICGESGEFADKVKKHLRGDYKLDAIKKYELALELGDVLWYIANAAGDLGYSLGEVAEMNIKKLTSRKDRGVLRGDGDNR